MMNFLKFYVYYPLFYISEIFNILVRIGNKIDFLSIYNRYLFYFIAQSSKGIDSVSIKDPKLVEFIASLLEVRKQKLNE